MTSRADLRALSDKATPGNWTAHESTTTIYGNREADGWDSVALTPCPRSPWGSARHRQWQADAAFIVACVNHVRDEIASGLLLPAPSYTDDDYRRLHAQLVEETAKLAKLEADVRSYEITIKRIDEEAAKDAANLVEVTRERDDLRAAIFGSAEYSPLLSNKSFIEMAHATEAGRKGALDRAASAEAKLATIAPGVSEEDRRSIASILCIEANEVHFEDIVPSPHSTIGRFRSQEHVLDIVDTIIAALPICGGGWQPMDTAPRDRTVFLVASTQGTGPTLAVFEDGYFRFVHSWLKIEGAGIWFWQPLPPAPSEKGGR